MPARLRRRTKLCFHKDNSILFVTNKVNHFQSLRDGSRERFLYRNNRCDELAYETHSDGHQDGVGLRDSKRDERDIT